ncbi:unannotated protein [freshwater metagenome]|uniref:Unannotated protein n=1 Tax=freshwater metagenome TaxID=449393 RepID=A0A6J7E6J9_9ZZZZ
MVVGADSIGHLTRFLEFVQLFEAEGKGLEWPKARGLQLLLGEGHDDGAVDAATEKGTDRYITDQMSGNRFLH